MSLNLITDPWIPVRSDGGRRVIRPDQIAEPGVGLPDWPRADLNLACLELLVGLVYLACPPGDAGGWDRGLDTDAEALRAKMAPLAPAFELLGDGTRFLQDLEPLEGAPSPPDMLFIDSAGGNTARNNADLMVRRARYEGLDLPMAAMALYTLQSFAPAGGAGNRTSMRGGGPMVCLIDPSDKGPAPLWSLIWANVPDGQVVSNLTAALPWLRPTRGSEKGQTESPSDDNAVPPETFFGMPRRLRLVCEGDRVTGIIQRPYGTNYSDWVHPLSPYYRTKPGASPLPLHPRAGVFSYRDWLGVVLESGSELREVAGTVRLAAERGVRGGLIVGGWSMDNMKPRDFVQSRPPLISRDEDIQRRVRGMIDAAELLSRALAAALQTLEGAEKVDATAVSALREAFYLRTQGPFEALLARMGPGDDVEGKWLVEMRKVALGLFDDRALPGLADLEAKRQEAVIQARRNLQRACAGRTKTGRQAWVALGLEPDAGEEAA